MTCAGVRSRLTRYALGELPPAEGAVVGAHLDACGACHAEWARLDPVGATAAFGAVRAPEDLAEVLLAAVSQRNRPVRRVERGRMAAAGGLALLGAWALELRLGIPGLALLVGWAAGLAGRVTAWGAAWGAALHAFGAIMEAPAIFGAALLVCAELAALRHWTGPQAR